MSTQNIQIVCAGCGTTCSVDSAYAGQTAQCPTCQQAFTVPAAAAPIPTGPMPPHLQNAPAAPQAPVPAPTAAPTSNVIPPHLNPSPQPAAPDSVPMANPAAVAAGPLPPHLAGGGPVATPAAPAPKLEIGDEDRKQDSLKSEYSKPKGAMGAMLLMMGAALVLIFVISMVAIFFNNPDVFRFEDSTLIVTDDSHLYPDDVDREIIWTDANKSALMGDVRVYVERVQFGAILAKDESNTVKKSGSANYLQIYLKIENTTRKNSIQYKSWYGNEFTIQGKKFTATLRDDAGNTYDMLTFDDVSRIAGHVSQATLATTNSGDSRRSANDVIIYTLPETMDPTSQKFFRLEMPAAAFGGRGAVRFEIAADSIVEN